MIDVVHSSLISTTSMFTTFCISMVLFFVVFMISCYISKIFMGNGDIFDLLLLGTIYLDNLKITDINRFDINYVYNFYELW